MLIAQNSPKWKHTLTPHNIYWPLPPTKSSSQMYLNARKEILLRPVAYLINLMMVSIQSV